MDAVVFLRFMRMIRNIFVIITLIGLAVILPVNLIHDNYGSPKVKRQQQGVNVSQISKFIQFTPQFGTGPKFWVYTVCAYVFDGVICFFIWWNYRKVVQLRRKYFQSAEYLSSLHSRTLMITHVPNQRRTDDGLLRLTEAALPTEDVPKTAISRNAKDLPELFEEHDEAVINLEQVLAKYLKNPTKLPTKRPACKPFKSDKARDPKQEVDAIDYLTGRIRELELEIRQVRESIDQRHPMPFGFASYTHVEDAHAVAYAARRKGPEDCVIRLASKPNAIMWTNLAMTRRQRANKSFWNAFLMTILTILYIVPNIIIAVFLSDFANLGQVWPGFQKSLYGHRILWGIVQGILAPLIQSLFYLVLPVIFRRLFNKSGDPTKTSRERHVASRLYSFYVFNQLMVFTIFASIWRFVAGAVENSKGQNTGNAWDFIRQYHIFAQLVAGLCNTSPYFITAQLQKNISATVDLIQAWPLIRGSIMRKFGSPTPRETIELSAPPPFAYAEYYNAYLYATTVGLAFATINPIILPITLFFIAIDCWLKKYLLQYVFITKHESGGVFWRMVINRLIFAMGLMNVVMALVVGAQGIVQYSGAGTAQAAMLYAFAPLPFLVWGFKFYLSKTFDHQISYFTTTPASNSFDVENPGAAKEGARKARHDRVAVRFGNPALYKKLKKPMVSARAEPYIKELYAQGHGHDDASVFGYSDVYMSSMSTQQPGKVAGGNAPFEFVGEGEMDFENFKRREEFREEFGGEGELYGGESPRPGSRNSMSTMHTFGVGGIGQRSESPAGSRGSSRTRYDPNADGGMAYPKGYHQTPAMRSDSPSRGDIAAQGHPAFRDQDADSMRGRLYDQGAPMGVSAPYDMHMEGPVQHWRSNSNSQSGSGPNTPGQHLDDETSYDYFRRGRQV